MPRSQREKHVGPRGRGGNSLRIELHSIFESKIGERDNASQIQFVVKRIIRFRFTDKTKPAVKDSSKRPQSLQS